MNVVLTSGAAAGHEDRHLHHQLEDVDDHGQRQLDHRPTSSTAINATGLFKAAPTVSGAAGSYAFATTTDVTTGGARPAHAIGNLQINQANFGTAISLGVQVDVTQQATQANLVYSAGPLASATVLQIGGANGYQVLNLAAGTTINQIATAINQSSDSTGIAASVNGTQLDACLDRLWLVGLRVGPGVERLVRHSHDQRLTHTGATRSTDRHPATINGQKATGSGLDRVAQ